MNNNIEILDIYEQEKLELKKFYDKFTEKYQVM